MSDSIAEVLCKDFIEENPKNELFLDFTKRALVLQRERVLSNFKEYLADANEPRIIHRYCRALEEGCITTPHRSRPDFGLYGGQLVGLLDSYGIQIAEGMLLGSHTAAAMTLIAPLKGVRVGLSDNFVAAYPQHALVYAARINDPVLLQSAMDAGADPLAPMIERDVYLPWDLAFDAGIKNNWGWECARRLVEFHHVSRLHPHQQDVIREALRSVWATDPEQLARASEFICSDLLGKGFPLKEATLHCLREGYEELFLELFRSAREDERPQVIALACESSSDDAGCPYTITPRIASAFLRHIESSSDSTSPIQAELITALRKRATEAPPTP
ncbi:hypothetical protein MRY87_05930 [bacterium]|nr:hypothetical protein [bacterium]